MDFQDRLLIEVFNRTQGYCFYCRREIVFHAYRAFSERGVWVIDRFIPVSKGSSDNPDNWVACSHRKDEPLSWEFDPARFRPDVWTPDSYLDDRGQNTEQG